MAACGSSTLSVPRVGQFLLQRLKPIIVRKSQKRLIRKHKQLRIRRRAVADGMPAWRNERIAAAPGEAFIADRTLA